jgi:hypothetical protein
MGGRPILSNAIADVASFDAPAHDAAKADGHPAIMRLFVREGPWPTWSARTNRWARAPPAFRALQRLPGVRHVETRNGLGSWVRVLHRDAQAARQQQVGPACGIVSRTVAQAWAEVQQHCLRARFARRSPP